MKINEIKLNLNIRKYKFGTLKLDIVAYRRERFFVIDTLCKELKADISTVKKNVIGNVSTFRTAIKVWKREGEPDLYILNIKHLCLFLILVTNQIPLSKQTKTIRKIQSSMNKALFSVFQKGLKDEML